MEKEAIRNEKEVMKSKKKEGEVMKGGE